MKTTKALFGILVILSAQPCHGAAWEGTDDFSSGISTVKWTIGQYIHGQMLAVGANGHVSFTEPFSTMNEQNANIIWNGTPPLTEDWTADIFGHNSASWSTNGASALQLGVAKAADTSTAYILSMSRRSDSQRSQTFSASLWPGPPPGDGFTRQIVAATNSNFGLRLVHRGGVAGNLEAWYDPTGNGTAWTLLDSMSVAALSSGMVASDTLMVGIVSDTYYGPIVEGDIWADNFRITNSAIGSPLPQVSLTKAVKPNFANLMLTTNYQLQVSSDLSNWTNQGSPFTATNTSMVYPQYWDVDHWGRLFFRLQVAP